MDHYPQSIGVVYEANGEPEKFDEIFLIFYFFIKNETIRA